MDYRTDKQQLLDTLRQWNRFIKRKVHLIACGGTALTLLGIKYSTKDVDFIVPMEPEYKYLVKILQDLGYNQSSGYGWKKQGEIFIFDLFPGNRIHTTELLESPLLEGNHQLLQEFSRLYVGILNSYDLIASKLFRGTEVDFEDCLMLARARRAEIDPERIEKHFKELARFDVSEKRLIRNIEYFMSLLREEGFYG